MQWPGKSSGGKRDFENNLCTCTIHNTTLYAMKAYTMKSNGTRAGNIHMSVKTKNKLYSHKYLEDEAPERLNVLLPPR